VVIAKIFSIGGVAAMLASMIMNLTAPLFNFWLIAGVAFGGGVICFFANACLTEDGGHDVFNKVIAGICIGLLCISLVASFGACSVSGSMITEHLTMGQSMGVFGTGILIAVPMGFCGVMLIAAIEVGNSPSASVSSGQTYFCSVCGEWTKHDYKGVVSTSTWSDTKYGNGSDYCKKITYEKDTRAYKCSVCGYGCTKEGNARQVSERTIYDPADL